MDHLKAAGLNQTPSVDCSVDPTQSLVSMFVDMVQAGRIAKGQCPALRPVFLKPHGVARGTFKIRQDLPETLKIGVFSGTEYPVWARFSSDTLPTIGDYTTTVGIGIKLFDVPGKKLIGNPEDTTFDFILQNFQVFFVDTAKDMCEFTKAGVVDGDYDPYLKAHPKTNELLNAMAKPVGSTLASPYWSGLPFRLGNETYVKYKLEPTIHVDPPTTPPVDPTYLAADLEERMKQGATFRFMVQLRTDPDSMPLDEATVPWNEIESPPIHVADLMFFPQDITARGQPEYGENLAMNIWRVTEDHAPVGSIAEARKVVYAESAKLRRNVNGIPVGEPTEPKPLLGIAKAVDSVIVRAAIHPSIGIARIGDSKTEYFYAPEVVPVPVVPNQPADTYRDATGAIKREAARFRLYGYNADGEVVSELTPDNADIVWRVELANRKAEWYQFQYALDIPEATNASDNQFPLRNPNVADRSTLAIAPGPRQISGKNTSGGPEHTFDTGTFKAAGAEPVVVPLGEIRTDEDGRLVVLGGTGASASPTNAPVYDPAVPTSFNNADDWYDDTSDGPVFARVLINEKQIPVDPAWVVVAPPNYAPNVLSWRTMYDLMHDVSVEAGILPQPDEPSFVKDILPILQRLSNLQWVNAGFAAFYGKGCPMDFDNPDLLAKLAMKPAAGQPGDPYQELRRVIFNTFRPPEPTVAEPVAWPHVWPWIYGDAFGSFSETGPGNMLTMTTLQQGILQRWVEGNFINDLAELAPPPKTIEDVPLGQQPDMLDKASLSYCLSDTFHPGCEMTWPVRHATMYAKPFRFRVRPPNQPPTDLGPTLNPINVMQPGGPLYGQRAGDITRWMAIPWQGDTAFCRSGYDPQFDPYLPTFWAARVPNQVLTEEDYLKVVDTTLPREQRLAAFAHRPHWLRAIKNHQAPDVMMLMIQHFGQLGIVEPRTGVKDDPDFPEIIYVETLAAGQLKDAALQATALLKQLDRPQTKLEKAGWASPEQLASFRAVRLQRR